MLTPNVAEQNSPGLLRVDAFLDVATEDFQRLLIQVVMIKEALERGGRPDGDNGGTRATAGRTYTHNPGLLPAYINSAKRALKLRALCDSDHDIEQHLELVFEGNVKVAWNQFYFEPERHMEAFHAVSQNTTQHPIAIQGRVNAVKTELGGKKTSNVLNILMNKYRADSDNPENGIGLEVSIWAHDASWISEFAKDDEVVVLGMWRPATMTPSETTMLGRFRTLTKRRLTLNMVLKTQVTKI
ncbi:hypothetical protein ACU683_14045 [Pseudomonas salmasensis]